MLTRRAVSAGVLLAGMSGRSRAEPTFPNRSIRFVVPAGAGGAVDALARFLADRLSPDVGQPVVVENKAGANGIVGTADVARSKDDHSFVLGDVSTIAINPELYRTLPYDPERDLSPISLIARLPLILVTGGSSRLHDVAGLLDAARSSPDTITYASVGNGNITQLSTELLKFKAQVLMRHVPYRSSPAALTDIVAGRVDVTITSVVSAYELIQGGQLRALAVTGPIRHPLLPDVRTVAEAGIADYATGSWVGLYGPASVSGAAATTLSDRVRAYVTSQDGRTRLAGLGFDSVGGGGEDLRRLAFEERQRWGEFIRKAGIQSN